MKYILSFLLVLIYSMQIAQSDLHCGTDVIMRKYYETHPDIETQKKAFDFSLANKKRIAVNSTFTIPVVFHILHTNGPENVSDAQVIDAMRILNRDFAKQNADTALIIPEFQALADSTKIQFALAKLDPNGNCTNGIIHYYDTDADWVDTSATLYQHTWDPTMYMNVYVVKTITMGSGFGAAGYTYFPGSLPTAYPADAIVLLNNYFGSIGTGNDFLSRVLTHEVGHWLGLYHVFGYTNSAGIDCSGDDYVNDTPTTPGYLSCPNSSNTSSYQICTPGVSENFQNYMDYSYCVKMFTKEQALYMQYTLMTGPVGRDNLSTVSNLISTGVLSPNLACAPIADFKYNRSETCVGTPVTFYDNSNNGAATSYTWSFAGGTPATSSSSVQSVVYNTPGVYSVTYTSASSAGSSLPITKTNIITVVGNTATYVAPFSESFESNTIPGTDWDNYNSSGGSNWINSFDAAYSGIASAKLPLTNNTRLAVSSMVSPAINLSGVPFPVLSFKLAAAESNPAHINNLKVFASVDCENSWTEIYSRTGPALVTTSSTMNPFIPSALNEWRNETISLGSMAGSTFVKFKFVYTRDSISGANNVFIDDINIEGTTDLSSLEEGFSYNLFPNPANETVTLSIDHTQPVKVYATDILGQKVIDFQQEFVATNNYTFAVGRITNFKPGVYFITIESEGRQITKKLIVN